MLRSGNGIVSPLNGLLTTFVPAVPYRVQEPANGNNCSPFRFISLRGIIMQTLRYILSCGTWAGLGSAAAVAAAARHEGRSPLQPLNATSHWIWGPPAGTVSRVDVKHTAVGGATHQLSGMFWGALFGWWAGRRHRSRSELICGAVAAGAVAAITDYGLMPRRLTPGWEHAVSGRGVAAGFVGLVGGLAIGALMVRPND